MLLQHGKGAWGDWDNVMMSAPFRCICGMALLLTCRIVRGQNGAALLEQQFKRVDSALSVLLDRPETRMKEIAPVENLFREALANRPEFVTILRTNSKGQIVNVAARDDSMFVKNTDVSNKEWYRSPQESKRPYYGPVIQENRRSFLFWSKPILVRNSMGMPRFGGVIAAKVNLPVCFKLFAARFQGPFQILLRGKEFYYLSWDEHASYEEKPVHIPGTSGLTCRFVSNKTNETKSAISGAEPGPMNPVHSIQSKTPSPLKAASVPVALKKNIGPGLAGAAMIVAVFITGTIIVRRRRNRKIPVEKTSAGNVSPQSLAKELDDAIRHSLHDDSPEKIRTQEMEEIVRVDLMREIKKEVAENEADILRNNERAEIKEDIRMELQKNEAKAIRAVVEKEMPLMVESYRKELSKEIRQKISDAFSTQIEKNEREELREDIRAALREEELEAMHASVKTEIYAETVRAIKAGLEEEYQGVVDKKLEEYREAVEKQVRGEIKGRIKSEYQGLVEHIERLSQTIGNVETLDSLSQTITLLHDEKKKYKYFNLNAAQTESLLEYLKRVQNRFNIFLDKLDEEAREMVLKVNSVMNTLDNSDLE